jgi:arsenate reductase-like glutaredoxin family protein
MTCVKTQEFLAKAGVTAKEQQDAKKKTRGADGARELLREADEIYVAKGKNVVHFDLKKDQPDIETVVPYMLGPTGNLRAPTLRKGRTLMVGFNKETYEKLFG